jgi:hypothetical protein
MNRSMATAALAALLFGLPLAAAQTPPAGPTVEADPVRCWWRTDRASIRMGEPFEAVLTCAALDTPSTKAIVDRSRLDHTVMALPPFDVLGGAAGEDVVTPARRFFQYSYQLRLLNDTAFGQDVRLAGLSIGYRIDTSTTDGTTSQGRDQSYGLPALSIRVLSLVAGDARDIRDASSLTLADLETRRFRARHGGDAGSHGGAHRGVHPHHAEGGHAGRERVEEPAGHAERAGAEAPRFEIGQGERRGVADVTGIAGHEREHAN